jgi:hypothetical protein
MVPAYLFQAPTGVPGDITRTDESNVEPAMLVALTGVFAQAFGQAMRYVTGGIQQFTAALTKADFAGVLVREVPSISGSVTAGFTDNIPNPDTVQGLLVRGYISVKCTAGTPVRGGTVYVRTVAASGRPIGAFEADSDSSNSFALDAVQAEWATDGKDADGNAELRVAR